jgi:hypothetical protein
MLNLSYKLLRMLILKASSLCMGAWLLLFSFGCSNCGNNQATAPKGKHRAHGSTVYNGSMPKVKDVRAWEIKLEEVKSKSSNYYIIVSLSDTEEAVAIEQYFISAHVLEGEGDLLASSERVRNNFQYAIALQQEQCLGKLLPWKGDKDNFKEKKPIKFKCKYIPSDKARQGDQHRLKVKVSKRKANGELVEAKQAEISITIKQDPYPWLSIEETLGSDQSCENRFMVNIHIPAEKPNINRYFISAKVLKGKGAVLAAQGAQTIALHETRCLEQLNFLQDATTVPTTTIIKLQCQYEPELGFQPGKECKVLIRLQEKAEDGKVVYGIDKKIIFKLPVNNTEPVVSVKQSGKYCLMTLKATDQHVDLNQYFICVESLTGQGMLYGAQEKIKERCQYKVALDKEVCLSTLVPSSGASLDDFQKGNPISYKFSYRAVERSGLPDTDALCVKLFIKDRTEAVLKEVHNQIDLKLNKSGKIGAAEVVGGAVDSNLADTLQASRDTNKAVKAQELVAEEA